MTNEQIKKIIANGKPAFYRLNPRPYTYTVTEAGYCPAELPDRYGVVVSQNQYLRELNPSSHAIYDKLRYPDKLVERVIDVDGEEVVQRGIEPIARVSVAFQKVIKTKLKNHITGNNLQFTLTTSNPTDEQKEYFTTLKQRFVDKNMNVAFAEAVDAQLGTGDCALYLFRDNKKLDWEVFSFEKGDYLIPKYDSFRRLEKLYRYFEVKDDFGKYEKAFMEINNTSVIEWRERRASRKREWVKVTDTLHGFSRIPVVYKRGKVAWDDVQDTIEELEWAFSQFCESNSYFAFPILFIAGNVDSLPQKGSQGKTLQASDPNTKCNFVSREAGDMEAFKFQIQKMLDFIFMGSFTVNITPEVMTGSGDRPASAIRMMLNNQIDRAIELAKEWDSFVDEMKELFVEGIGIEDGKSSQYKNLNFRLEIKIYIPENMTEIVNNLNMSVANKTLSKETAQQKNPYSAPDENKLYKKEQKFESELENTNIQKGVVE